METNFLCRLYLTQKVIFCRNKKNFFDADLQKVQIKNIKITDLCQDNPSTAMVTSDPPATAKIEESPQVDTTPDEPTKQLQSIDSTVQMTKQETTQKARQVQRSVSGDEPQQQFSMAGCLKR